MNLITSLRPFGYWYSVPDTLHTEGEWLKEESSVAARGLQAVLLPSIQKDAAIQTLQPKGDSNVLWRNAASLTHKYPYQEESKLFNSLQAESLKSKRGLSSAHTSNGPQKGTAAVNTAASVTEKNKEERTRLSFSSL